MPRAGVLTDDDDGADDLCEMVSQHRLCSVSQLRQRRRDGGHPLLLLRFRARKQLASRDVLGFTLARRGNTTRA